MRQAELIADELSRALDGGAWHGPALEELLSHVTAEEAMQRPIPTAHNIWELVLHLTSWANIVRRRLTGGQAEPFPGEDWPVPAVNSEEAWAAARTDLAQSHELLRVATLRLPDERFDQPAPQSDRTVAAMLHGVAQHDAYHGGQIAMLKKVVSVHHRRTAL